VTALFTIIAKNYLAYARVLMVSAATHHPEFRRFIILIDEPDGCFDPGKEPTCILPLSDFAIPHLPLLRFKYTLMELSTAVKPFVFEHLFRIYHFDTVLYFDPDIMLLTPLSEMLDDFPQSDVILTPHATQPLPPDGRKPAEHDFLMAGVYNLGFLALHYSGNTSHLLRWWQAHLYDGAYADFAGHLFTDQKWIDLVPALFDKVKIERSARYNTAYWNLMSRTITLNGEDWLVNGEPLCFFHFSGLDPENPAAFSKHQDRYRLEDLGDLQELVRSYCERILSAGYRESRGWRYTYDYLRSGLKLRYRHKEALGVLAASIDPFSQTGESVYLGYWNSEARSPEGRHSTGITKLAYHLYSSRSDVRLLMPDIWGADEARFLMWFISSGRAEYDLEDVYLEGSRTRLEGLSKTANTAVPEPASIEASQAPLPHQEERHSAAVIQAIYDARTDLQALCPEVRKGDHRLFATWLWVYGRYEYGWPETLARELIQSLNARPPLSRVVGKFILFFEGFRRSRLQRFSWLAGRH
jgi:hypothetical protein